MKTWMGPALALVAVLGCRAPVAVVSVEDPFDVGSGIVALHVGEGEALTQVVRPAERSFPLTIAVQGPDGATRSVRVLGVDGDGNAVASGETAVTFRRYGEEFAALQLRPPCEVDADCVNTTWCDGVETCVDGRCLSGTSPCGAGTAGCLLDVECIESTQACVASVDHSLCPAKFIDGQEVQTYCDVVKGCTEGIPCVVDDDCNDGSVCNGRERCEDHHCIRGVPEQFDDDNPCTRDVCVEDESGAASELHHLVPDGNVCDVEGVANGICLQGTCVASTCGDGFVDERDYDGDGRADEECDDGDANADLPDRCKTTCRAPAIGDGYVDASLGEACDDGNDVDTDSCTLAGAPNVCGDGVVNLQVNPATGFAFEECDDGPDDSDFDACRSNCVRNVCGDGLLNPDAEACDDGNSNASDGCNQCRRTEWVPSILFGLGQGDGVPSQVALGTPGPMALDRNGNLFWTEVGTSVVRRYDADEGAVTLFAGDSSLTYHGDNGPATRAGVAGVFGMAIDGKENVFISDFEDHRVRRIDGRTGVITTVAGDGRAGFSGDGGPGITAQLSFPTGLAVDGVGNLYIADSGNGVVRVVDAASGVITTLLGQPHNGEDCVASHDPMAAADVVLCGPGDVEVAANGDVYVAEVEPRQIRKYDPATGVVSTVGGHPNWPGAPFAAGPQPATASPLGSPFEMELDAAGRFLYFTSHNRYVRRLDLQQSLVETISCRSSVGYDADDNGGPALDARCDSPTGVVVDRAGDVYFSDQDNHVIRKLTPNADASSYRIDTWIGDPASTEPINLDDDATLFALFFRLVPGGTSLQFARLVDKHDPQQGIELNVPAPCNDDGNKCMSVGDYPFAIVAEQSNRVFIGSTSANFLTLAGTGVRGFQGDGGDGRQAALNRPRAVSTSLERLTVDDGTVSTLFPRYVYVADTGNHRIRRIELVGTPQCCDRNGDPDVFVSTDEGGTITTVIGTGVAGISDRDGPAASFQLDTPSGMVTLSDGRVLVSDTGNHRIVEYDPNTQQVRTLLGKVLSLTGGDFVGAPGYTAFGVSANHTLGNNVELNGPFSLTSFPLSVLSDDAVGDIVFFADRDNHKARAYFAGAFAPGDPFAALSEVVIDIAGSGVRGYGGDGEDASLALLEFPRAVMPHMGGDCLEDNGGSCAPQILVADGADRVRVVSLPLDGSDGFAGTIDTLLGAKEPQFDGDFSVASLRAPVGMTPLGDELGSWLFTDDALGTVRTFAFGTQVVETVAGFPKGFDDGDGDQRAQYMRELEQPAKLVFNPARNEAYVAEAGRHVIRRLCADGNTPDFRSAATTADILVGQADVPGTVDGTAAEARLHGPYGMALDVEDQVLFFSERGSHTVRAVRLGDLDSDDAVFTLAGQPGTRGAFAELRRPASGALLNDPRGLAFAPAKGLYIADTGNHRVRRIADPMAPAPDIEHVLGDSSPASSGEGPGAAVFPVDTPVGLELDNMGNLFVSSRTAVRLVASGDDRVATGADVVRTIYGSTDTKRFPESVTRCIDSVKFSSDNFSQLYIMDACLGHFIRLQRQDLPFDAP